MENSVATNPLVGLVLVAALVAAFYYGRRYLKWRKASKPRVTGGGGGGGKGGGEQLK